MTERRLVHVVDDEEPVRRSLTFLLRTSGFDVRVHETGTAFLKTLREAPPGCILLDIRMPEMDGLEVQRELSRRGVTLPIIVLTGHGDVPIAVAAMKAGAVEFLEKPFEKAMLLAALEIGFASQPMEGIAVDRCVLDRLGRLVGAGDCAHVGHSFSPR